MGRVRQVVVVLLLFLKVASVFALEGKKDSTEANGKNTFVGVPLIFYTPETNWGVGGAGVYVYRPKALRNDSLLNPTQFQFGFSYTLNQQLLGLVKFQIYLDSNRYTVFGETGYFRYNYDYFGTGNGISPNVFENYSAVYPRARLNALGLVAPNFFVGLRYWAEHMDVVKVVSGGLFDRREVPGVDGGWTSGIGFTANYDSRDYYFYPASGTYLEIGALFFQSFIGSDYTFNKYSLDLSRFISFGERHVLALNTYHEYNFGDPPFNLMSQVGGQDRMRGYYLGIYRDKHMSLVQAEYRVKLFWRLGAVVFAGNALVADDPKDLSFSNSLYNVGGGIRLNLNKKEQFNLRFDAGFGKGVQGFYLTVREAF